VLLGGRRAQARRKRRGTCSSVFGPCHLASGYARSQDPGVAARLPGLSTECRRPVGSAKLDSRTNW